MEVIVATVTSNHCRVPHRVITYAVEEGCGLFKEGCGLFISVQGCGLDSGFWRLRAETDLLFCSSILVVAMEMRDITMGTVINKGIRVIAVVEMRAITNGIRRCGEGLTAVFTVISH